MSMEAKLQSEIIKYLKGKHCFVMKCSGPGVPTGTADLFFCLEGFYGFIEVKASAKSPYQPLQPEFITKMNIWSWAKAVHPGTWPEVKAELEKIL